MNPLVSVIVPVYNGEKYISNCIESIVNQSYRNIEIIIINDGSSDRTHDILVEKELDDRRIRVINQENRGVSSARNQGVKNSIGEYIVFVDADDTVENNYVSSLADVAIEKNLDVVACGYNDLSAYGINKLNDFYTNSLSIEKIDFISRIFDGVGGTLWGKIFKGEIIRNNGMLMKPNIYMCEDMIFVLEYSMYCKTFGAISDNLYNYNRLNDNSISKKINFSYFNNMVIVMNEIENILKENNYDEGFINIILKERIKNLVMSFSIMQHDKVNGYSNKVRLENLRHMLDNSYINKFRGNMSWQGTKEKILGFFINRKMIKMVHITSYYIYLLNNLKYKIKKSLKLAGG